MVKLENDQNDIYPMRFAVCVFHAPQNKRNAVINCKQNFGVGDD